MPPVFMLLVEASDKGNFVGVVEFDRGFVGDERLAADFVLTGGGSVSANGEQDDGEWCKRCREGDAVVGVAVE
jgi:hypothetical protein